MMLGRYQTHWLAMNARWHWYQTPEMQVWLDRRSVVSTITYTVCLARWIPMCTSLKYWVCFTLLTVCPCEQFNTLVCGTQHVFPQVCTPLRHSPLVLSAGQNRLLALNYIYPGEDPAVCDAHAAWGESFQALHGPHMLPEVTPAQRNTTPGRPLRVR